MNRSIVISCSIVLIAFAVSAVRYVPSAESTDVTPFTKTDINVPLSTPQFLLIGERIDINAADTKAFEALDRVGPKLAERIVEDRETNGPFESVDDLERVPGIGPKILDQNRHYLKIVR